MNKKQTPPQITKREVCTKSRLFTVETIGLRFSNGTEVEWERLTGSKRGAVLIVPMLDAETVLLIREYAAGVERYELALPKGKIDDGESIIDAANREMMEEIGYGAKHLRHIDSVTVAPGYLSHTTHIVLCSELYPKKLEGDEPEEMMEEIGYGAKHLRHIDSVTVAPGYLSHTTHIVLCSELYPKKLEGDEPEEIEVVPWKLNKLNELIVRDDVTEARTIAALYMVRDIMRGDV